MLELRHILAFSPFYKAYHKGRYAALVDLGGGTLNRGSSPSVRCCSSERRESALPRRWSERRRRTVIHPTRRFTLAALNAAFDADNRHSQGPQSNRRFDPQGPFRREEIGAEADFCETDQAGLVIRRSSCNFSSIATVRSSFRSRWTSYRARRSSRWGSTASPKACARISGRWSSSRRRFWYQGRISLSRNRLRLSASAR